jgi:hypothetical protein
MAVVWDDPPKYVWGWGDWFDALDQQQLCTLSGLKLACFNISCPELKRQLHSFADLAAGGAAGGEVSRGEQQGMGEGEDQGSGLLPWFFWARDVLLRELQCGVWRDSRSQMPDSEQLQQRVMARVQLAHVVLSVFEVLKGAGEEWMGE